MIINSIKLLQCTNNPHKILCQDRPVRFEKRGYEKGAKLLFKTIEWYQISNGSWESWDEKTREDIYKMKDGSSSIYAMFCTILTLYIQSETAEPLRLMHKLQLRLLSLISM